MTFLSYLILLIFVCNSLLFIFFFAHVADNCASLVQFDITFVSGILAAMEGTGDSPVRYTPATCISHFKMSGERSQQGKVFLLRCLC